MNRSSWSTWVGVGAYPGRRVHPALVAALVAVAVGLAGLWYGRTTGQPGAAASGAVGSGAGSDQNAAAQPGSGIGGTATVGDITVRGAYLREPASPDVAAAYMSITDTGSQPDTLVSAYCGAARDTTVHDVPAAGAVRSSQTQHVPSGPVTVAAGATLALSPGRGHVMLTGLTGRLRPGDDVSLLLTFQRSGQVLVELPVIAIGAAAPDGTVR